MQFDRKDINMNKLLVTGLESKFHVFDLRTLNPKTGFASLTESVRTLRFESVYGGGRVTV